MIQAVTNGLQGRQFDRAGTLPTRHSDDLNTDTYTDIFPKPMLPMKFVRFHEESST